MKAEGRNRTSNAVKKLNVNGKDTKDASKILSIVQAISLLLASNENTRSVSGSSTN